MSLDYPITQTFPVIGSKSDTTRTAVTLPTSYNSTVTKTFETSGFSKVNFDVSYTMGATETSNSIELKIEGSTDGTNFYRLPNENTSGGTSTLTAREFTFVGTNADNATISLGLDIFYAFVKISAKESGVVTNAGTIYVEATLLGR